EVTRLAGPLDRGSADDRFVLHRLADAWQTLGSRASDAHEDDLARSAFEASLRGYEVLTAAAPDDQGIWQQLAWSHVYLSNCQIEEKPREAASLLRRAEEIWERLVAASPKDRACLEGQGYAIGRRAYAVQLLGDLDEARR